jgi:hypothetical protein
VKVQAQAPIRLRPTDAAKRDWPQEQDEMVTKAHCVTCGRTAEGRTPALQVLVEELVEDESKYEDQVKLKWSTGGSA